MKMETKTKIVHGIAIISKLMLCLGLLIVAIGCAMLIWGCKQLLGWKVMMTGGLVFFLTIVFSFMYGLDDTVAEVAKRDYIKSFKEREKDGF